MDEATQWRRFAVLLPPARAADIVDCWEAGEQETGLGRPVAGLLEHQVPTSETARAEIGVTAEAWGHPGTFVRTPHGPR
ncbi:hypothetical protein E5082_00690 [Streptomyces griseoluteus]|uniref:Uncharacterized protein n=1 Tax=Streptomyces griseoluteus TaxID=29306 RepID=A0A4Z1DNE4_STRGP|nr:hypothetical protein [Streptomyces griseoluteus]TGN86975.1 hypothetical protein E5082_00690 [Streptomyces griseoluteus]GHF29956.1 hypothetical protein GCM10017776_55590 [Streptomyces griseoluteus]